MSGGFKYACFISYSHGEEALVKNFIDQFKAALKAYLEPWMDEEVFVDVDRLKAGFKYNEALAEAICQSVCMIVVYSPVYERRPYCGREYEAMERLEKQRLAHLAGAAGAGFNGLIIPVVLRGFSAAAAAHPGVAPGDRLLALHAGHPDDEPQPGIRRPDRGDRAADLPALPNLQRQRRRLLWRLHRLQPAGRSRGRAVASTAAVGQAVAADLSEPLTPAASRRAR